jgi:hypothetical protein
VLYNFAYNFRHRRRRVRHHRRDADGPPAHQVHRAVQHHPAGLLHHVAAFVLPFIFNPNQANLGAKTSFIFGGLSVLCWIYLFFYQPETANRSFEEIDEMFFKHVPARQFRHYVTDSQRKGEEALHGKVEVQHVHVKDE